MTEQSLSADNAGQRIEGTSGDVLTVKLQEIPGTGQTWLASSSDAEVATPVSEIPVPPVGAVAPGGARPSYTLGYYPRDNSFYAAWDAISRERDTFLAWMQRHVVEAE